ncbi:MAG: citramalate synthase [bacterium]
MSGAPEIYDTTLRDGAQAEGILFSLDDKIRIAHCLDDLGVHFIEAGGPGMNPKDTELFRRLAKWRRRRAKVVAFGFTCRPKGDPAADAGLRALLAAKADVATLVGKSSALHVRTVLKTGLEENLRMISESVAYVRKKGLPVFFDAEHFFDGYAEDPDYAVETLLAAEAGGAQRLVLCDTNGGMLPDEVGEIVMAVSERVRTPLGIHAHNDGGLAVANSLAALNAGAVQAHGTINGYGERCGNADLCALLPALVVKMGLPSINKENLKKLTRASHFVSEMANRPHPWNAPYTGRSAFAHKAGIHVNAIKKEPRTYEHIAPESVGNLRRVLISEQSGRANVLHMAEQMGIELDDEAAVKSILRQLKQMEFRGYQFEGAEASFEMLVRKNVGRHKDFFELDGFRVTVDRRRGREIFSEATVRLRVLGRVEETVSEGDGPVNALDNALRKALQRFYPSLREMRLTDYKVRVLDADRGTAAKVRVLITSEDGSSVWSTVGVSTNVIQASWLALVDSIEYKLLKDIGGGKPAKKKSR